MDEGFCYACHGGIILSVNRLKISEHLNHLIKNNIVIAFTDEVVCMKDQLGVMALA